MLRRTNLIPNRYLWIVWCGATLLGVGYFAYVVKSVNAPAKAVLLPGETTHGHYQIELSCNACHTEFMGVKQDACTSCHAAELKASKDTHPASKFNDPTNADRLALLDAQKCITCHREHVPDRTHSMGVSLPQDYCFHCHEDVAEQRPSHIGMSHDSCSTAGCHNYHDNSALYEKFLYENCDQSDVSNEVTVALRNLLSQWEKKTKESQQPLTSKDADAPTDLLLRPIVDEWASTAHAAAGVSCRACHDVTSEDGKVTQWQNDIGIEACRSCHKEESETFVEGRHGMRLALGLSKMTPSMARLPMHEQSAHKQLDCSACHSAHGDDTKFAAVDACISCHNDEHTNNYKKSIHYELWQEENSGNAEPGTGVSCATCHMPRIEEGGNVHVQHNQNSNLRPNEKMIRSVCMSCHGLEFSLNSLADSLLIERCFQGQPTVEIDSAQMAKRWFEAKEKKKKARK